MFYNIKAMVEIMRVRQVVAGTMVFALCLLTGGALQAAPETAQISTVLQQELETIVAHPATLVNGDRLHSLLQVASFYKQRNYRPAWTDGQRSSSKARALAQAIEAAGEQGLASADYHMATIRILLAKPTGTSETMAQRDLLLTDSFITYARNLAIGKMQPRRVFPEWNLQAEAIDAVRLLSRALEGNKVAASLTSLAPTSSDYIGLRQALAHYRAIKAAGGWPEIQSGPELRLGVCSKRVRVLIKRLRISGDLSASKAGGSMHGVTDDTFDVGLEQAVERYQRRMGIKEDGIVGRNTLAALNVSVGRRIHQIAINMERLRWLPRRLGERYILVNIPAFTLTAVERGDPVLSMRAIVGKDEPNNTTPVFTAPLSYLVLNPYWYIPDDIFVREILPRLRHDPGLLASKHIHVLPRRGGASREIDPASIDWNDLDIQNLPYRLRQNPGPVNDLGTIKFISPNPFDIYLHDTPYKSLFDAHIRNLSHGCVRVEHPVQLAAFVLHGDANWGEGRIREAIASGKRLVVHLPKPMPIYFLYRTAWVDTAGIHFRDDIYQRDRRMLSALR